MQFKDYYNIMGVTPEASQDDIKRSYRKLARKYHPDVSKESNAEEKFKEVGEAYEVLKDPEKRAAYDKLRKGGYRSGEEFNVPPNWDFREGFPGGGYTEVNPEDFSDFFETLFGGRGAGRARGRGQGGFYRQNPQMRGEDVHYKIPITLEEAYHGTTQTIELRVPEIDAQGQTRVKNKKLKVKIPAGVIQGQQIRLAGQGAPGFGGGPSGDLYLEIVFVPHPFYTVEGHNVILTLPIAPWEAALGAKVKSPSLGGTVEVKIPPDSQTGAKLRLKKRGLPGKTPGDQIIILKIVIPNPRTEKDKQLYQEMEKAMPFNPRQSLGV